MVSVSQLRAAHKVEYDRYGFPIMTSTGTEIKCAHSNGWYDKVDLFWGFQRKVFVCTDCCKIMKASKRLEP